MVGICYGKSVIFHDMPVARTYGSIISKAVVSDSSKLRHSRPSFRFAVRLSLRELEGSVSMPLS